MKKNIYQAPHMDVVQIAVSKDILLTVSGDTEVDGSNALAPELYLTD